MIDRVYMAASVPRYLRQTKLGYLPVDSIIGTHFTKSLQGANLVFDVIMLPVPQFQRMRMNVGSQFVAAPTPSPGGAAFSPVFVLANAKQVVVPPDEPDPKTFAKNYFLKEFGLLTPPDTA